MLNTRIGYSSFSVVVAVCLLTGCSDPGAGVAQTMKPGLPEGLAADPLGEGHAVAWIEPGATFAIVTWGSSSCPAIATALTADSPDSIAVTFGPSPNDPCTANMAPTTHEFELPEEITASPVVIEVSYEDWPDTDTFTLD